ncbi:hypothetical protein BDZ85DRAFT_254268 [Elsinoe ampelina]|uniref:Uncharacterized protein n=1 Tax=Elsinoe ampelina TaxID=302913 RepID=A0A6A6GPA2_9PEZI|nr:hypothetical protein BDZ85DRAFT_254268 [Elsinoe ampelina]
MKILTTFTALAAAVPSVMASANIDHEWQEAIVDIRDLLSKIPRLEVHPVDPTLGLPFILRDDDPEKARTAASHLAALASYNDVGHYRARTWGYTVLRTDYIDEVKFQTALSAIRRFPELWIENDAQFASLSLRIRRDLGTLPAGWAIEADKGLSDEFLRRYTNDVLQDPATLTDASTEQIVNYLRGWAFARWPGEPMHFPSAGGPRLKAAILLDKETIDQLQELPTDLTVDNYRRSGKKFWVKMVECEPRRHGIYPERFVMTYRVRLGELVGFYFARLRIFSDAIEKTYISKDHPTAFYWGEYGSE